MSENNRVAEVDREFQIGIIPKKPKKQLLFDESLLNDWEQLQAGTLYRLVKVSEVEFHLVQVLDREG